MRTTLEALRGHLVSCECSASMLAQIRRGDYSPAVAILTPRCLHHGRAALRLLARWADERGEPAP